MPYEVPTLRELIEGGLIDIESSLDRVLEKFGIEQALNVGVSASIRDLYDYQTWIVRQIIPTSESEEQTIVDIARTEGVIRKLAAPSTGPVTFRGTSPIPLDTLMTHKNGLTYRVTQAKSPNAGIIEVTVQCEVTGPQGDLPSGETLTLTRSVPNVNPEGTSGAISGGADIETIASLLERLLFRKRNPPMGGAIYDYVAWCREVAGVTRAWSIDRYQGGSTVGYAFVFDERESILPTPTDQANMKKYIFRHSDPATGIDVGRPGGIEDVYIPLKLKTTKLTIKLIPDTTENRDAVTKSLKAYWHSLSNGSTLYVSKVRTAIGNIDTVEDYKLSLTADVPATTEELHALGEITWGTP